MLTYMVYASMAVRPMVDEELTGLLKECRANNAASGVTGILLYKEGRFLQMLEGEQRMDALFEKIERDPRHEQVNLLVRGLQSKRQFAGWSMGFANLCDLTENDLPGFSSFFSKDFDLDAMRQQPARVYQMMLKFRQAA